MLRSEETYNDSISLSYAFNAIFLATVPLAVRRSGLSFEAIRIISLKIRLNAGAALFAWSTIGLKYGHEGLGKGRSKHDWN